MIGSTIGTAEEIIHWLFEQPKGEHLYEIKERKRKRTLTQNAYYWAMLNQLGRVLRIPTSGLHLQLHGKRGASRSPFLLGKLLQS